MKKASSLNKRLAGLQSLETKTKVKKEKKRKEKKKTTYDFIFITSLSFGFLGGWVEAAVVEA